MIENISFFYRCVRNISVSCEEQPDTITNGHLDETEVLAGSSVDVICDVGYKLTGGVTTTCDIWEGKWRDSPTCVEGENCNYIVCITSACVGGYLWNMVGPIRNAGAAMNTGDKSAPGSRKAPSCYPPSPSPV